VTDDTPTGGRRPYRPPVGIPEGPARRWRGLVASIAIHVGVVALLLIPPVAALIAVDPRTAGFLGLRGGGGGGHPAPERLHFMNAEPPAPATSKAKPTPPVPPPRITPAQVPPPTPPPAPSAPATQDSATSSPSGGAAGTNGSGPGTGGGIGAGTGPGVGNGKGPETGGDGATKIKATAKLVTAYSVDPPKRPRPFHLVAVFEVAANGVARLLSVNKADDGDFNKKMRDHLLETEFRPATLANGTPVADTVVVTADY
jgi:protein TonB